MLWLAAKQKATPQWCTIDCCGWQRSKRQRRSGARVPSERGQREREGFGAWLHATKRLSKNHIHDGDSFRKNSCVQTKPPPPVLRLAQCPFLCYLDHPNHFPPNHLRSTTPCNIVSSLLTASYLINASFVRAFLPFYLRSLFVSLHHYISNILKNESTALIKASGAGQHAVAKLLLEAGADINATDAVRHSCGGIVSQLQILYNLEGIPRSRAVQMSRWYCSSLNFINGPTSLR